LTDEGGHGEASPSEAGVLPLTEMLTSFEPATGAEIWTGTVGDAAAEVAAARAAWPAWAAHSISYRIEALRRFANEVRSREQEFADLIARETGKPYWEAKTEVAAVIGKVDISVGAYLERTPSKKSDAGMGAKVAVRHKPHGVLAVLGPYNFPAHLPNGHIVPALIAGNAVVFKPSEKTPATGAMLVECFHAAGIPEGVVRLLIGGPDQGRALASQDGIDGLLFTGSARAGMALHRQFADMPHKILALELGGNNPLVVWDAADMDSAAAMVVQSAYLSAGQRCTAARRLIVSEENHDPLIDAVTKLIDRIIVDHPHADPQPFMGPVIDIAAADHVQSQYMELMMKGGTPIRRLDRPWEERPYLTPALIDVTAVRDRPDDEIFGPVLQLIRVRDFDAAIDEANRTRFGLAASVITKDPKLYDAFWANVRAGVINWNRPTNGAPSSAPFGGIGMSGNHRPSAYYAADYCAYPVTSGESEVARAAITEGLRDLAVVAER
jgi:succinylglutamic semialdehyde dehydrogenase